MSRTGDAITFVVWSGLFRGHLIFEKSFLGELSGSKSAGPIGPSRAGGPTERHRVVGSR